MIARLTIEGPPRTKKNHGRILRMGSRNKVMPSESFMEWQAVAVPQLRQQWATACPIELDRSPLAAPVQISATFYRDARRGDLVGYMQALADVLEKAEVLKNDSLIVSWDGTRMDKDASRPRVELTINTAF